MAAFDITQLGSPVPMPSNGGARFVAQLSPTRAVLTWSPGSFQKYVQVFSVNRTTGEVTALDIPLMFYGSSSSWSNNPPSIVVLSETSFIIFWTGNGNDGFCRTFQVNASTGEVTSWGAQIEFDTSNGQYNSAVLMTTVGSTAKVLNAYTGSGLAQTARLFDVNLSNGAVTVGATTILGGSGLYGSLVKLTDSKALLAHTGGNQNGVAQTLDVNITTNTVTVIDTHSWTGTFAGVSQNSLALINPLTAINAFYDNSGFGLRPFSIDGSWEVSNLGSATTGIASGDQTNQKQVLFGLDSEHLITLYSATAESNQKGIIETREFNPTTGSTTAIDTVEFTDTDSRDISAVDMGAGLFVVSWTESSPSNYGYIQSFQVELPAQNKNPKVKIGGEFRIVPIRVKQGGVWTDATMKTKVNGEWI